MVDVVQEKQLSAVLSDLARTLATDFPIQGILDHLVERIVEVLPITSAGVTLIHPVRLALDDFGTGYSSLSYLRRLPIDIVKIDQGFIADIGHAPRSRAIAAAVTALAHVLGLTVTAEGVETESQRHAVSTMGCDATQGYFYARPMSAATVAGYLAAPRSGALRLPPADPLPTVTSRRRVLDERHLLY
jgi:c-di-GMP-related signal transduction protein